MKLYRRSDSSVWWVSMTIHGKTIRQSTKLHSKKEAEMVAAEWYRNSLNTTQLNVKPEITLAAACQRYIDIMVGAGSHSDLCRYRDKLLGLSHWSGRVFHLQADMPMSAIRTHVVASLREARRREGLSNNTVNLEMRFLQRVWNLCRREWGYATDPDTVFTALKVKPKTRYLSADEVVKVLAHLDRPTQAYRKARALTLVLLTTGLRLNEATSLRWSQIDPDAKRIRVYRQKTQSWSVVPLMPIAAEAFDQFRDQSAPFLGMNRAIKLLRGAIDAICNTDSFVMRSAGKATIHSLRDTYATNLVSKGMSLYQVSKLLGHTSQQMSAKYAHLEGGETADHARKLMGT